MRYGMSTPQGRRVWGSLLVLGVCGATALCGDPAGHPAASVALDMLRTIPALCLLLVVPGGVYLPLLYRLWGRPPRRSRVFYTATWTALVTLGCHVVGHKAVLLIFGAAESWEMLLSALVFTLAGALLSARWGGEGAEDPEAAAEEEGPQSGRIGRLVGACAVLVGLVVITSPPHFVEEDDYYKEDSIYTYHTAENLRFTVESGPPAGLTVRPGEGWVQRKDGVWDLSGNAGTLHIRNTSGKATPVNLKMMLKNLREQQVLVDFTLDGARVEKWNLLSHEGGHYQVKSARFPNSVFLMPRYNLYKAPRDAFTNLRLIVPTLHIGPGAHQLEVSLRHPAREIQGPGPRLRIFDLSFLAAADFHRRLKSHFFIGDVGDIRETLDFAAGFKEHMIQHSHSYDGESFDGGGPTSISDEPPGHHFVCYLAQTFRGDSITTVSLLYLLELALTFCVAASLVTGGRRRLGWGELLILGAGIFAYSRLCRLGVESNAPETLFLLVWLCATKAYLDGRTRLAHVLVGLSFLIHVLSPQCVLFLCLSLGVVTRSLSGLRFLLTSWMILASTVLVRFLLIASAVGFHKAWFTGQAFFLAGNRLGNFKALLLSQDLSVLPTMAGVMIDFFQLIMIASCGAAAFFVCSLFLERSAGDPERWQRTLALFIFGVIYFLSMSLVDGQRAHHLGQITVLLIITALRGIACIERRPQRQALYGAMVLACLGTAAYMLHASPDPTGIFTPFYIKHYLFFLD